MRKENYELLKKSLIYTRKFYLIFALFLLVFWIMYGNLDLSLFFLWLFFGNLIITILNQYLHYRLSIKLQDYSFKDRIFEFGEDCFVRCFAGVLEMILYILFFATQHYEIVVGYLVIKTISTWKSEKNEQKKEGLSTAVLRIATVISIIISYIAAHYLPDSIILFFNKC